jgi:lipoprotein-releasing system permease protein
VLSHISSAFGNDAGLVRRIADLPGITGELPFIYTEVMLSAGGGVKGVVLRGVDPQKAPHVLTLLTHMQHGSAAELERSGTPGIIVGAELARRLALAPGSRVNLLSPSGQRSATGYSPRVRPFEVAGIFKTGMFEYDSSLAFVTLEAARDILGLPPDFLSGIEITVDDVFRADEIAGRLADALGPPFYVRTWMDMNANLFAALKLEKFGMFILLAMVVLIGSFSIVTSLVMLVMEKTRDIAIMMSMGATAAKIRRIFMLQGTIIGLVGTLLGYALGFALGFLLKRYQFIKLPDNVYTTDHLPIMITAPDVILVGASALALCFAATLYPARQAARLNPAEALRYE